MKCHLSNLAAVVLIGATSAFANEAQSDPPQSSPHAQKVQSNAAFSVTSSAVIFVSDDFAMEELSIVGEIDPRTLAIPFRSGEFAMIGIQCAGFTQRGQLEDCSVNTEPNNAEYEAVGRELARRITVDDDWARSLELPIKVIRIQAKVSNSDVSPSSGPCWPTSCTPVPKPPPPPPRPPLNDPDLNQKYETWKAAWANANETLSSVLVEAAEATAKAADAQLGSAQWLAAREKVVRYSNARFELDRLLGELSRLYFSTMSTSNSSDVSREDREDGRRLSFALEAVEQLRAQHDTRYIEVSTKLLTARSASPGAQPDP